MVFAPSWEVIIKEFEIFSMYFTLFSNILAHHVTVLRDFLRKWTDGSLPIILPQPIPNRL